MKLYIVLFVSLTKSITGSTLIGRPLTGGSLIGGDSLVGKDSLIGGVSRLIGLHFDGCDVRNPNLNDCMRTSIEKYYRLLDKPVPLGSFAELHEPFRANSYNIGPGRNQFDTRLHLTDIKTYGWARTELDSTMFDLKQNEITLRGRTSYHKIKSTYEADGKILGKTFKGAGPCLTVLENVNFRIDFKMEVYEKIGIKFWRFTEVKMTVEPENVRFEFGNQPESFNREINEHSDALFAEVKQDYEGLLAATYFRMINFLFEKVPVKFFFLNY